MKKLVFLITIFMILLLSVACGKEAATTSPDTTNAPIETSIAATTTPPTTTTQVIFDTDHIKAITLYVHYGQGEGNKLPDEHISEFTAWLKTFALDKEADNPLPPGTNTYCLEIEYLDGTVVKKGLDVVEIEGRLYYVKHGKAPEWFETILTEPFVTTAPKLVVVHPESYEAISISASSCKGGTLYDSSSQYDAEKTLENCEMIDGDDVPLALRETGLNETSSEEAYIAYAKKLLSAYVGEGYGLETLWVGTKSTVKEGGFFVENDKSGFISVKDRAEDAVVFYDFIFYRGDASSFPRAQVSVRSDGKLLELWIYKELYMDRFGEIYLYNTALTDTVNALQHENQTKKTTSVRMGKTHLYLVVNIDHESYFTDDWDENGNAILRVDEYGNPIADEHLRNTYYILLAEIIPENEVSTYGVKSEVVRVDCCLDWNDYGSPIRFDDQEGLDGFVSVFKETFFKGEFTPYSAETLVKKLSAYDEDFFAQKSLLLIKAEDGTGSAEYSLDDIRGKESLTFVLKRTLPQVITHDMACWFMIVEIDKNRLQDVSAIDAIVETEYLG